MSRPHSHSRRQRHETGMVAEAVRKATRARLMEQDVWAHTKETVPPLNIFDRAGNKISGVSKNTRYQKAETYQRNPGNANAQTERKTTEPKSQPKGARSTKTNHAGSRETWMPNSGGIEPRAPRPAHVQVDKRRGYQPKGICDNTGQREKLALGAERAMYRRMNIQGSLAEQRQNYRSQARKQEFERNESRLIMRTIAGSQYYTRERPQADAVDEVRYQYEAKIRHEAETRCRGIADPYSENINGLASPPLPTGHMAAMPKEEFDALFASRRLARQDQEQDELRYFDIPNYRDNDEWFRVNTRRKPQAKLKKAGGHGSNHGHRRDHSSSKNGRGCLGFLGQLFGS